MGGLQEAHVGAAWGSALGCGAVWGCVGLWGGAVIPAPSPVIILSVVELLVILLLIFLRKRILIAVALIKEAGRWVTPPIPPPQVRCPPPPLQCSNPPLTGTSLPSPVMPCPHGDVILPPNGPAVSPLGCPPPHRWLPIGSGSCWPPHIQVPPPVCITPL